MKSYREACKTLELDATSLSILPSSIATVRKQYKMMALKYHPDKNKSPDANARYQEIKEAHDFLLKYLDIHSSDEEHSTWSSSVSSFFETLYNNEHLQKRVFHPLLMKIIETCETKIFEKMDATRATKIYDILLKYKDSLHLSDEFLQRVNETIRGAPISKAFVLNPNLDDMLDHSVYKLKIEEETYYVPLWHSELIYNKSCVVQCEPELPDNVELDEDNNVHVFLTYNLFDLWRGGEKNVEYFLGKKTCSFPLDSLHVKKDQVIVKLGEGIPVANGVEIFSVERLSDVYLHITLI
jgi:hypothetical protein